MCLKNNLIISDGTKEDRVELYDLWQASFHDTKAFADYYFERIFDHNRVLALREHGEIVSMLHLNPYQLYMNGEIIASEYLVGVATKETHRHRGYMRLLLISAMERLYLERKAFVYLMPAKEAIYTPFNFTFIYQQPVMNLSMIKANEATAPHEIMSRQAGTKDLDALVEFVNAMLKEQFEVFAYRDRYYFENLLEETQLEDGQILLLYKGDVLIGYLAAAIENGSVLIRELIMLPDCREQVFGWLKADLRYSAGKLLLSTIEAPFRVSEYKPVIMARIIHLEQLIELIKTPERFSIRIKVADPILAENNGKFLWTRGLKALPENESVDLEITIEALTAWLFGYKTLDELLAKKSVHLYTDCKGVIGRIDVIRRILLNEFV